MTALILLMEAIIQKSRSINQNYFYLRETQSNYRRHMSNMKLIQNDKIINLQDMTHEVDHISNLMHKSNSAARLFKKKQQKQHLKNQNAHLIKKICHLEPIVSTHNSDNKYQYVSGSNWGHHQKKQAEIKDENRRIGRKMLLQHLQSRDFKAKLKAQIKDYLELRDQIRKTKKSTEARVKRSLSEMRMGVEKMKPLTERKVQKHKKKAHNNEEDMHQRKQQVNNKEVINNS